MTLSFAFVLLFALVFPVMSPKCWRCCCRRSLVIVIPFNATVVIWGVLHHHHFLHLFLFNWRLLSTAATAVCAGDSRSGDTAGTGRGHRAMQMLLVQAEHWVRPVLGQQWQWLYFGSCCCSPKINWLNQFKGWGSVQASVAEWVVWLVMTLLMLMLLLQSNTNISAVEWVSRAVAVFVQPICTTGNIWKTVLLLLLLLLLQLL